MQTLGSPVQYSSTPYTGLMSSSSGYVHDKLVVIESHKSTSPPSAKDRTEGRERANKVRVKYSSSQGTRKPNIKSRSRSKEISRDVRWSTNPYQICMKVNPVEEGRPHPWLGLLQLARYRSSYGRSLPCSRWWKPRSSIADREDVRYGKQTKP